MPHALPAGVQRLVAALQRRGYRVTAHEKSEAFANEFIGMTAEDAVVPRVHLVRDRGIWNVDMEVQGELHAPYLVVLALDGASYESRALNHDERYALTLEALSRLSDEGTDMDGLKAELRRLRAEYADDLFGGHEQSRPT